MPAPSLLDSLYVLYTSLWIIFLDIIKAFLPMSMLPRKNVKGDVVLVTGAGSGIGRIMAVEFAKLDASVVLWDVNDKANKETQKIITDMGLKAAAYTVDLSKRDQIYKKAQAVRDDVGHVNILVNNAGVVSGKHLLDCTDEQIERTMTVNATCHMFTAKAFLPHMLEANRGHIVTIASVAGMVGCAQMVDYCSSKFAALGFHEALTAELHSLGKDGVKTTAVCPYFIDTGMFDGFQTSGSSLLPPLTPQYVVDCIMDALLTDRSLVAIPKFNYIIAVANRILPTRVTLMMNELMGGNEGMKTFKGRSAMNGKH